MRVTGGLRKYVNWDMWQACDPLICGKYVTRQHMVTSSTNIVEANIVVV
jgi:hypothetical protein